MELIEKCNLNLQEILSGLKQLNGLDKKAAEDLLKYIQEALLVFYIYEQYLAKDDKESYLINLCKDKLKVTKAEAEKGNLESALYWTKSVLEFSLFDFSSINCPINSETAPKKGEVKGN